MNPYFALRGWLLVALCLAASSVRADAVVDFNTIVLQYKQGRWPLAARAAEDFLAKYPTHEQAPVARLYLGQSLAQQRKFDEAHSEFTKFLDATPDHPDRALAMYRLGECSYFSGKYELAAEELARFVQAQPANELVEWGLVYLGESQFRTGKFEESLRSFEQALAKFPGGPMSDDARYGRGHALEALDRDEDALREYEDLLARPQGKRSVQAAYSIGARRFSRQEFAKAAEAFDKVIALDPASSLAPQARLHAGYALYHLQQYPEAIKRFAPIVDDPQQGAAARFWMGLAEKSLGRFDVAAGIFESSLTKEPLQPLAIQVKFQWADALAQQKKFVEAEALFLEVWTLQPAGELADDALHSAGESALMSGNPQRAREHREQFLASFSSSGMRVVNDLQFGRVLLALADQPELAESERKQYLTQAVAVLQNVAGVSMIPATQTRAHYQLARAYERLKQQADVVRELQFVLAHEDLLTAEELSGSILLRAHAALETRELSQARADYERFLTLSPEGDLRRDAEIGLTNTLIRQGDWDAVERRLKELAAAGAAPRLQAQVGMTAGEAALAAKDWKRAAAFFQTVAGLHVEIEFTRPALSGLAQALYDDGRFAQAAEAYERLSAAAGDDRPLAAQSAYYHALSLQQAGEPQAALAMYQSAAAKFSALSIAEGSPGRLEAGFQAYQSATGGARLARQLNQRELAERFYETAHKELRVQPPEKRAELDRLINEWAELSYSAQDYVRSDQLFALLISEVPISPLADHARLILGESKLFGGDRPGAKAAFEELLARNGVEATVVRQCLVHLLDLAAGEENWSQVQQVGERLQREFPNHPHQDLVAYRRAEALVQQEQNAEAVQLLEKLRADLSGRLETAPEWWPEAWVLLAECRLRLNDYAGVEAVAADLSAKAPQAVQRYKLDMIRGRALVKGSADFDRAREAFGRVVDSPDARGTPAAAEAHFRIAETFMTQKNYESALLEYSKVTAGGYDAPKWQAMALFQSAACDRQLGNGEQAKQSLRMLREQFPNSEYAALAGEQLEQLEKP